MTKNVCETVLTYVQRFQQLADMVYPNPNNTQTENLIRWMCLGLRDKELVRRLMRQGRPATLAALIDRIHQDCASDNAFQEIYQDEPMEVGAISGVTSEIAELRQEIAALKLGAQAAKSPSEKEGHLEQRIKDLAVENAALRRALDNRGQRTEQPAQRKRNHDGLVRFKCGKTGHIKRACRVRVCPHLRTTVQGVAGHFLVDTGAAITILSQDFIDRLRLQVRPTEVQITTIDGSTLTNCGATEISFDCFGAHPVVIVLTLVTDGIIGSDLLSKYRVTIDLNTKQLLIDGRRFQLTDDYATWKDRHLGQWICAVKVRTDLSDIASTGCHAFGISRRAWPVYGS